MWIWSSYWNQVGRIRMSPEWRIIHVGHGYMSKIKIWYQRIDDDVTVFLGVYI